MLFFLNSINTHNVASLTKKQLEFLFRFVFVFWKEWVTVQQLYCPQNTLCTARSPFVLIPAALLLLNPGVSVTWMTASLSAELSVSFFSVSFAFCSLRPMEMKSVTRSALSDAIFSFLFHVNSLYRASFSVPSSWVWIGPIRAKGIGILANHKHYRLHRGCVRRSAWFKKTLNESNVLSTLY